MLRVTVITNAPQGSPWYANHFFGGTTEGEAVAASDAVRALYGSFDNHRPSTIGSSNDTEVHNIDPSTGQTTEVFDVPQWTENGAHSFELLPYATQGLIRWRTGTFVNGRELRGRTFVPGLTEDYNVAGVPSGGLPALMAGYINTYITTSSAAGDPAVYSPTHKVAAIMTNGSFWSQWAVLRSRRD